MTLPDPIDPAGFSVNGTAPVFATHAHPAVTTPDEALRNTVAWVGEVTLAGVVVYRVRVLGHVNADSAHVIRHARETAAAEFAVALAGLMGVDPAPRCERSRWCALGPHDDDTLCSARPR